MELYLEIAGIGRDLPNMSNYLVTAEKRTFYVCSSEFGRLARVARNVSCMLLEFPCVDIRTAHQEQSFSLSILPVFWSIAMTCL